MTSQTPSHRKVGLLERLYHPIYATCQIRPNSMGPYKFLESRKKTDPQARMECNLDLGNMLHYPYHFQVTGFSIIPSYQADPDDVREFIDAGHFCFRVGSKEYLYTPLDAVTYYNHLQGPNQIEPLSTSKLKISEPVYELPEQSQLELIPLQTLGASLLFKQPLAIEPFNVHLYVFGYQLRPVY